MAQSGKDNPNYKHGKYCTKSYCKCGNPKDLRAKQCAACAKCSFVRKDAKDSNPSLATIRKAVKKSKSYDQTARLLGVTRSWITSKIKKHKYYHQ